MNYAEIYLEKLCQILLKNFLYPYESQMQHRF